MGNATAELDAEMIRFTKPSNKELTDMPKLNAIMRFDTTEYMTYMYSRDFF